MTIVFIGTAEFGVPSLATLLEHGYPIAGVITGPDKPTGRGLKLSESPVKKFAAGKGLKILQPGNLKDSAFQQELKSLQADLQIVIAFRMLPAEVWQMPPLGTFNLHASLLPQYRGAAPINWAIMNGEKETGVTTFFLQQEIDTGKIIYQEKVDIGKKQTADQLHDQLMLIGSELVLKTVQAIEKGNYPQLPQAEPTGIPFRKAPKIFKNNCKIDWNQPVEYIYNFIRGLSPYPAAWAILGNKTLKIFSGEKETAQHHYTPGTLLSDHKSYIKIAVLDGFFQLTEVQLEGRNKMKTYEFLRGYSIQESSLH